MAESRQSPLSRWRYGFHPHAAGMQVRSLSRVHLQLGEALRLEMGQGDPGEGDTAELQYYIATELGPWAVWLSSDRGDVAECEQALQEVASPFQDETAEGDRRKK